MKPEDPPGQDHGRDIEDFISKRPAQVPSGDEILERWAARLSRRQNRDGPRASYWLRRERVEGERGCWSCNATVRRLLCVAADARLRPGRKREGNGRIGLVQTGYIDKRPNRQHG